MNTYLKTRMTGLFGILLAIQCLLLPSLGAEVKLPAVISSNMVLQRNDEAVLWGWAEAGEKISIEASWLDELTRVEADSEGNWKAGIRTGSSPEAQTITIQSENSEIILENVLLGEVWLCSGQSNMQFALKGWDGEPTYGSAMAIARSENPDLRLFSVDLQGSKTPLRDLERFQPWQQSGPLTVPEFSAVAYFFGKKLQEILDCPVGIIHTSYSGSSVQTWMSHEVVSSYQEVDIEELELNLQSCRHAPTVLFNAMINPLIPYTIKGVLWYQGEENRREPENYRTLFPAMVRDWRSRWGKGDFPFYYVQIAPFPYGRHHNAFQSPEKNSAFIREVQLECLDSIPNSGIVITMDIGDDQSIHPPRKEEVADRLLYTALNKTYGYLTVDCVSPFYDSFEVKNNGIILRFGGAEDGLYARGGLEGFEIAGEDRVFYPATARIGTVRDGIKRNEVFVSSDKVPDPAAVRYAWRNYISGTLFDTRLLPASSFRTDKWDNATQSAR